MNTATILPPGVSHPVLTGIIDRAPKTLKSWGNNPRTHDRKQLSPLKASIHRYGFTMPVLLDEADVILSGHGRVMAALELGLASVPTRVISGLTEAEKRAYVIGDNKSAMLSAWDPTLLKSELELLVQDEFEIETTGFSTAELDLIFDDDGTQETDDLRAEDVVREAVTQIGDLWRLDGHRLLCGDALAAESYAALAQPGEVQMVITDPPYNVRIDGHVGNRGKIQHAEFAMASGEMDGDQFTAFLRGAFRPIHDVAADGAIVFAFMDWRHTREILAAAEPIFGHPKQLIVWSKDNAGLGTFYRSQHELVYVFKKGSAPHINNFELGQHGRYRTNVWTYPGAATFKGQKLLALHPTVKPVGMIADAIRDCSHRQGLILDPFAGSGTILLAAERTGRYARAIELDPGYVDVAINRWQRVTGNRAVLAATGQSWDEVRELRQRAFASEEQR